jgi:hypothetical protein
VPVICMVDRAVAHGSVTPEYDRSGGRHIGADHSPASVTLIAPPGPGMGASHFALQFGDLLGKCVHLFGAKPATDHKSRKRRDPAVRDIAAEGALYCAALSAQRAGPREHRRGADISKRSTPPPLTTVPLETRSRPGTKSVSVGDKICLPGRQRSL